VHTVRMSQNVGQPARTAFGAFARNGMDVVATMINDPQPDGQGHNPAHPPDTPAELATYRQQLAGILDSVSPPKLVQVENEEVSTNFFVGSMSDYVNELNAAVEVAHARGIKVTNGGITDNPVALLVWQDYKDRGLDAKADDFASRAFSTPSEAWILHDLRAEPFTGLSRQGLQDSWDRAEELIAAFRQSAMDYVNFHWYTDDPEALRETAEYLARVTFKPVVTTEIGQHNTIPSVVTGHLGAAGADLHLPLVLWFDWDGDPAMGLHTPGSPGALRPNGEAFRDWVAPR
jgi:hypothetical protein